MTVTAETETETDAIIAVVKLRIENVYELYPDVTFEKTVTITLPIPDADDEDARDEWEHEQIQQHTGVGHEDGDSWYDVEIIEASEPGLVGRTFAFGY